MALSIALTAAIRTLLVVLFLPFSALDKILNFRGAVGQAKEGFGGELLPRARRLRRAIHRDCHADRHSDGLRRPYRFAHRGGLLRHHRFALEAVLETG